MTTDAAPGPARPAPLPPQWRRVQSIGVVGSRGTGKTCFFGATYGLRADGGASLEYQNEATVAVLKRVWGYIARGESPPATAVTLPAELGFRLGYRSLRGTRRWSFSTIDYAGEFVQLSTSSAPKLKDEARRWLAGCDAVLFFVGLGDTELLERLNELNVFISELQRQSGRKNELTIPVGLVLTKWDAAGPISTDPAVEDRRAAEYVNGHPHFRQIAETVRNCGDWVRVFPVSAFGGFRGEVGPAMQPPPSGAQPFNVLAPLVWAAEQASNLKTSRFVRSVKRYTAVAAAVLVAAAAGYGYDTLKYTQARDALAADGTPHDRVRAACDEYTALVSPFKYPTGRQAEIVRGLAECDARTALALAYDRVVQEPTAAHEQEFLRLAEEFGAAWPDARDAVKVKDRWAEVRPRFAKREFDAYQAFRAKNAAETDAPLRAAEGEAVLARLKNDAEAAAVRPLLAEDRAVVEKVAASQRLVTDLTTALADAGRAPDAEKRYARLAQAGAKIKSDQPLTRAAADKVGEFRTQLAAAADAQDDYWFQSAKSRADANPSNPDEIETAYKGYLDKGGKRHTASARGELARLVDLRDRLAWEEARNFARNANPTSTAGFRQVVEKVDEYERAYPQGKYLADARTLRVTVNTRWDDFDWNVVTTDIKGSPGEDERHLRKLNTYLGRQSGCAHADEARKSVRAAETNWDRREWSAVEKAVRDAQAGTATGVKVKAAYDAAKAYATGTHPLQKQRDAALGFVTWYDGFDKARDVNITVVSAFIPAGSDLDENTGPDCKVEVTLNNRTQATQQIDNTNNPQFNSLLGPYSYARTNRTLYVRITDEDAAEDDFADRSVTDDFVLGHANSTFEITCKKGRTITVTLRCDAAVVPGVPAYPAN